MGLLTVGGAPIIWGSKAHHDALVYVRDHGIQQLINLWLKYKGMDNHPFLWGDEIEHTIVKFESDSVKVSLDAAQLIDRMCALKTVGDWKPEYASYMIESVPAVPYQVTKVSLQSVEKVIQERFDVLNENVGENKAVVTLVSFPLLGCGDFTTATNAPLRGPTADSLFVPDVCINQTHPRFSTLTKNIRLRRGRKVCIQIPLFLDKKTLESTVDPQRNIDMTPMNDVIECHAASLSTVKKTHTFEEDERSEEDARTDPTSSRSTFEEEFSHLYTPATDYYYAQYTKNSATPAVVRQRFASSPCPVPCVTHPCVYMDCMCFGMGLCCLQVTTQLKNIDEARNSFDQLLVMCPWFLALTSATPIQKGLLCDSDVRWLTISSSVDDRQPREVPRIIKSRYDSVSRYISPQLPNLEDFNDNHVEVDERYLQQLLDAGMDKCLATHFAHLFIRDPLVIFDALVQQIHDDERSDHFENVQSTNWQTVRFKPPPFNTDIGWRVEFRVMEVMPTAFENAAFSVFVILVARAFTKYNVNMYIPMSLVDLNMGKAHRRNPCSEHYYCRRDIFAQKVTAADNEIAELSINEIFNGGGGFVGLVPLARRYAKEEGLLCDEIERYFSLISRRATGELKTTAQYLRSFVLNHPLYAHDSRVNPTIARDIVLQMRELAKGGVAVEHYLPADLVQPTRKRTREGDATTGSQQSQGQPSH